MKIETLLKELPVLETERLLLRKVALTDSEDVFEFSSDPVVAHHMTWEKNSSKEETLANFLQPAIEGYEEGQCGTWAIVHKESDKVIGICSFVD